MVVDLSYPSGSAARSGQSAPFTAPRVSSLREIPACACDSLTVPDQDPVVSSRLFLINHPFPRIVHPHVNIRVFADLPELNSFARSLDTCAHAGIKPERLSYFRSGGGRPQIVKPALGKTELDDGRFQLAQTLYPDFHHVTALKKRSGLHANAGWRSSKNNVAGV